MKFQVSFPQKCKRDQNKCTLSTQRLMNIKIFSKQDKIRGANSQMNETKRQSLLLVGCWLRPEHSLYG